MPYRKFNHATGGFYFISNKGVDGRQLFYNPNDYFRFLALTAFYKDYSQTITNIVSLNDSKQDYEKILENRKKLIDYYKKSTYERNVLLSKFTKKWKPSRKVELLAYSILPNQFYFFLKQTADDGVEHFMKRVQLGYSMYFNIVKERSGTLWQGRYKSTRVETEDQFLALSKYIHTRSILLNKNTRDLSSSFGKLKNPLDDRKGESITSLISYPYSSYANYVNPKFPSMVSTNYIFDLMNRDEYVDYVENGVEKIEEELLEAGIVV